MSVEIDYAVITTFDELAATYDHLTERLCSLVTPAHLRPGKLAESLFTEDGERLIVSEARDGHRFLLVIETPDRPKPFFTVPNERGKVGRAGAGSSARGVLGEALGQSVGRMANTYAWAGFAEEYGFVNGAVPKDIYNQLLPQANGLRQEELKRLHSLLGTDWP